MIKWIALLLMLALPASAQPPTAAYTCKDAAALTEYQLFLTPPRRLVVLTVGQRKVEIQLGSPEEAKEIDWKGRPLWLISQKDTKFDYGTFAAIHTETLDNRARLTIELTYRRLEQLSLRCQTTRFQTDIRTFTAQDSLGTRAQPSLQHLTQLRDSDGRLIPTAVSLMVAQVQRLFQAKLEAADRQKTVQVYTEAIRLLDPESTKAVRAALPLFQQKAWDKLLNEAEYAIFPETLRYIAWIQAAIRVQVKTDSTEVHYPSLRSGLRGFLNSAGFSDASLTTVFLRDVGPLIRRLPNRRFERFADGLSAKEKMRLTQFWPTLFGDALEINFAEVKRLADLVVLGTREHTEWGELQYGYIEEALREFMGSAQYQFPEARAFFQEEIKPDLSALNRQNWKALGKWLSEDQFTFLYSSRGPLPLLER